MGKLDIKQKAKLHNKFHLVLTDSRTGKVKQEAWAYNIILDQGFEKIIKHFTEAVTGAANYHYAHVMRATEDHTASLSNGNNGRFGTAIFYGTGTGALDPERTELFTHLGAQRSEYHDHGINLEEGSGYYTQKINIPVGTHVGVELTEVGLGSQPEVGDLTTHALIEDSEGNPITVTIGEFDEVTIYGAVFTEIESPYGDGLGFVHGSQATTGLLQVFCNNSSLAGRHLSTERLKFRLRVGAVSKEISLTDGSVIKEIHAREWGHEDAYAKMDQDFINKKFTFSHRIASGEANDVAGIHEIGFDLWVPTNSRFTEFGALGYYPLFRSVFPIPTVWEGKDIEGEEIGTGDGAETDFNLQWPFFLDESEAIKVDAVAQVRGTDYNVHRGLGTADGKNNIGAAAYLSAHEGEEANYPPALAVDGDTGTQCRITEENISGTYTDPPWIIFDSFAVNYTDRVRLYQGTTGSDTIRAFKFQGSADGSSWTTLVDDEMPNSLGWQEFVFGGGEVGYRYWRLLIETSWGTTSQVRIYEVEFFSTRPHIRFEAGSIPGEGDAITADYTVEFIPKDENHVLDVSFTLQFADGNA